MIIFETFINKYMDGSISVSKMTKAIYSLAPIFNKIQIEDNDGYLKVLKCFHEHICGAHFDEFFAVEQVKNMFHTKQNGIICKGEIYDIEYAKNIHDRYTRHISSAITIWDVYVALNAQYHDHCVEYNLWFHPATRQEMDEKVVSAAITFWFRDEDAGDDKVWNYFKNIG